MDQEAFVNILNPDTDETIQPRYFDDYVRSHLSAVPIDRPTTTADLATQLLGTAEFSATRKTLYNMLKLRAKAGLADCMSRGAKETTRIYGKVTTYRPRLWHKSDGIVRKVICKACGQEISTTKESSK